MFKRIVLTLYAFVVLTASALAEENDLVQQLKQLGKGVDDMAANISQAESDAVAQQLAQVTQQTFASQMTGNPKLVVVITASRGH